MVTPRMMFDDGSRIIQDNTATEADQDSTSIRGDIPIETYYETIRVANEAVDKLNWSRERHIGDDGFICRVALQFPDDLLADASQVTWLMEEAIATAYKKKFIQLLEHQTLTSVMQQHLENPPLVFVLGDSTYGSCCPDEVAAQHLNADVLIHYGYACLSSTSQRIPVVYAFGVVLDGAAATQECTWNKCVESVSAQIINGSADVIDAPTKEISMDSKTNKGSNYKFLVLYDLQYHHVIETLPKSLEALDCSVILGSIPKQRLNWAECANRRCCDDAAMFPAKSCCQSSDRVDEYEPAASCGATNGANDAVAPDNPGYIPRSIGGFEISDDLDLSDMTLLYVGDDLTLALGDHNTADASKRYNTRLLHILIRCSASDGCKSIWSYSPACNKLNCDLLASTISPSDSTTFSSYISRFLRRRYYLVQKVKMANTIGILIGTTTTSTSFRLTLARIRHRIQSTGRTAYTFAVGKLATSSSKVSNFAEIDCFVLIACQESYANFWRMEREEMMVPVITPFELDVALGVREWDGKYSCDLGDLVRWDAEDGIDDDTNREIAKDGDDRPFFSMISGKYEIPRVPKTNVTTGLENLPGQGQIMEYRSEAAEFLRQREYQGLEANVGLTEARAAVLGMTGIASNYGEDTE